MGSDKVVSDAGGKSAPPKGRKRGSQGNSSGRNSVGEALRDIYHGAVSEPVPDEMLDLLNKLG